MKYRKVNKPIARNMYNKSFTIKLFACKVNGKAVLEDSNYNGFIQPCTISLVTSKYDGNWFDRDVNEFEFYNCNSELGYYSHFYVSEEDYNRYLEIKQEV